MTSRYKPVDICFIQANIRDMTSWMIARKPLTRIDDVMTRLDCKKQKHRTLKQINYN